MTERSGLSKWPWFQAALSVFLMAMMVRAAITGDKIALVMLVVVLMFCTYLLGDVIGSRSAERSQSKPGGGPHSDAEGPVG